uniref:Uncharacterized protein n=1 Tax=Saccharomyces cerevisiae TaxID=4932 RepID=A2MYT9_YEASX|nr:unknown protein [Saccharomyces cerevisiae]
MTHATIDNG